MASCCAGGLHPSSRPHKTKVGQVMVDKTGAASGRVSKALICAANCAALPRSNILSTASKTSELRRLGCTMPCPHCCPIARMPFCLARSKSAIRPWRSFSPAAPAGKVWVPVSNNASRSTRWGAKRINSHATLPPMEWPATPNVSVGDEANTCSAMA